MNRNEQGYSLIEMLFVLAVVALLSFFIVTFSFRQMQLDMYEQAIKQFELDLLEMQALAMNNGGTSRCWMIQGETLECIQRYGESLVLRKMPENMRVNIYTTNKRIEFNGYGSVINFGKVEFVMGNRRTMYSINLGRGRMRLLAE
ncbi:MULTISPECIES: type II secretion system protein [Bacillales]|uniref:Type II secretion system protein n=1 Tax=Lysinibacillus louembei TaxID=1470088 RepID=A0ABZ0RXA1_9BACI|nr:MULTISPECIES: type II secretion system protein [Bacillales]MCT6922643.1 type II secretion system GspH family protein [Metasolibacillus sp.]MCT6939018.1 type II secretion system GspH family protein [Metasolibacillus sp.]WPK11463.1 type II secretion system protein [Lysinibacillus louembei]